MSMTDIRVESIPAGQAVGLNQEQVDTVRAIITERLHSQRTHAAQTSAALDELSSTDSPSDRQAARAQLGSLVDGARQYEDALGRIAAGTYGVCSKCQRPIPFERLEAIPEVRHCMACIR